MSDFPFEKDYFLRPVSRQIVKNPYDFNSKIAKRYSWILKNGYPIKPEHRCLDIGSGLGQGCCVLSQKSKFVIGTDISNFSVQFANNTYGNHKLKFICSDFLKLSLDQTFDNIFCVHFLEHISKKDAKVFVNHLHQFCNSNTYIYINVPLEGSLIGKYNRFAERISNIEPHDPTHISFYGVRDIVTLFNKNDYKLLKVKKIF